MIKYLKAFYVLRKTDLNVLAITASFLAVWLYILTNMSPEWYWAALLIISGTVLIVFCIGGAVMVLRGMYLLMRSDEERKRLNSAIIFLGYIGEEEVSFWRYDKEYLKELRVKKESKVELL